MSRHDDDMGTQDMFDEFTQICIVQQDLSCAATEMSGQLRLKVKDCDDTCH